MDINNDILAFQEKIKRHLSDEYLFIVEKKDDLENQLLSLQTEKEKKNKTLFPGFDQKDIRKYFSPLNLKEPEYEDIDEKDRQISIDIERVENDIRKISQKMSEIKEIIHEIDDISKIYQQLQESALVNEVSVEEDYLEQDNIEQDYVEQEYNEDIHSPHYNDDNNDINSNLDHSQDGVKADEEKDNSDHFETDNKDKYDDVSNKFIDENDNVITIYPQMLRNLYEFSDFLKDKYDGLEVLIEFSDNNIETPVEINKSIVRQIACNIEETINTFNISGILIQGEITSKRIYININYVCDNKDVDALSVIYECSNV